MRLFLYEYTCAIGTPPGSLRTEGEAMLGAIMEDFARMPGVEVATLRDVPPSEEETAFRTAARRAEATFIIAPEFDDILLTRCRWAEESGRVLSASSAAIALTADKLALAAHLRERGVPTPMVRPAQPGLAPAVPAVCKPRFGAGSQAIFLLRQPQDLPALLAQVHREGWTGELLLQQFVPGQAASVAFLVGPRQRIALPPAAQHLSDDGCFHYRGGEVPLPDALARRAQRLADTAVAAVDGLRGWIGVDLVLGAATDGSDDTVIEINPRLTTSYIGLRALAEANLAAAMLNVAKGEDPQPLRWRPGTVRFDAAGGIQLVS